MGGHDIVVIGCSAGGVETLSKLLRHVPAEIPAAIFVVMHVPAVPQSFLPEISGQSAGSRPPQDLRTF